MGRTLLILLLCLSLLASPAWATAPSVVQCGYTFAGGPATSATVTLTGVVAGHALVAQGHWDHNTAGSGATSASWGGSDSWTTVDTASNGVDVTGDRTTDGYALNSVGGSVAVTLTLNVADSTLALQVCEIDPAGFTLALDQHGTNYQASPGTGTDAVTSGTVTTTTGNQLVIGFANNYAGTAPTETAGTGYAIPSGGQSSALIMTTIETATQTANGAIATTFTQGSGGSSSAVASLILTFKTIGSVQGCYVEENNSDFYLLENSSDKYALEGGDGGLCAGGGVAVVPTRMLMGAGL